MLPSILKSLAARVTHSTTGWRKLRDGSAALVALLALCVAAGCGGGGAPAASSGTGAGGDTGTGTGTGTGSGTGTGTGTGTGPGTGTGGGSGTTAAIYVVGASAALPAGATRVAALTDVPWSTLPAGSQVIVSTGTYSGVTTITAQGSPASPITVTAADAAHPPVLTDSVDFQGAAWVQVSHVVVQTPTYAGFVIRLGSQHVTVSDSTIDAAPVGISITGAAGTGHRLLRNVIADSLTQGISVDVNADPAERTLIQYNKVLRSGQHGIEVRASHYQVEYNSVSASGQASGGTSGIHLYSGAPAEDSGDDNLVRYNESYGNVDAMAFDGNGIEVDQWCDRNVVAYNLVWGNDGAGVIVYDGHANAIEGNTATGNGQDSGHTHVALGEIIVGASADGAAVGNHVWNNLLAATRSQVPALYVDSRALAGANVIGANLYHNAAGGTLLRWGDGGAEQTQAQIDAATGIPGSSVVAPAFADATQPLSNGLRLTAQPDRTGLAPSAEVDFLGDAPQAGWTFFGAYFTAP